MNANALLIGGMAAGAAGAAAVLKKVVGDGHLAADKRTDRWLVVTINATQEEVAPGGRLPGPIAELGDTVQTDIRPAPGDKGTELAARPRTPPPAGAAQVAARVTGNDPRQPVRLALRQAKSIIETGEVLEPDRQTTTKRTLTNLPLELAIKRARGEGVL
jgi:hypothetical protein